jgi:hypothetical protein
VSPLVVATAISRSHLAHARVLVASVRARHPELACAVLVVDDPDGRVAPAGEAFEVLGLADLALPQPAAMRFRYGADELVVAVKPALLRHLLDRGAGAVLYLDADVLVTGDLTALLGELAAHPITLVPHLLAPLAGGGGDEGVRRELDILRAGVFNLGVVGVAEEPARPAARRFLAWWAERLERHCRREPAAGLFGDQRWVDLAPGCFPELHVVRDPGVDVAHWNLRERPLAHGPQGLLAGGAPCRVLHFSGFDPERPELVSRHAAALATADVGPAGPAVFARYAALLRASGLSAARAWPYGHDRFENGVPIPAIVRRVYALLEDEGRAGPFGDPFATAGPGSFFAWLRAAASPGPAAPAGARPLTNLWREVLRLRPDVQEAYPAALDADREAFHGWTQRSGVVEHAIPPELA